MILADKIIRLRKKNGWSQEELAEKMNVSRQAVSKWEGAQAIPDIEKILQLGELFGVTTDYLLKDDMEDEEFADSAADAPVKRVTLAEANEYLELRKAAASHIAAATFLCILSPIALILLSAASDAQAIPLSQEAAALIGLTVMFVLVAAAVAMYVLCGFRNSPYEFLEKEDFETEYGVKGMVREKQRAYRGAYIKMNVAATCLCVLSPIPLLTGEFMYGGVAMTAALAVTMVLVGVGVMHFIVAGVRWASMQKLLKEGEYAGTGKLRKLIDSVETIYWILATAIYLGWSFITRDWHITWVVWPVAGVLSSVISAICKLAAPEDASKR